MTISDLREMLAGGSFHHATYRDIGKVWEGLAIYRKDADGFRGFSLAGSFHKETPELPTAMALISGTGWSLGSYGNG